MSPASAGLRSPRALGGGGAGRGLDWSAIDLVVFDVDGTLYDQARLRRAMLAQLARASLRSRSLDVVNALRHFRRVREWLADQPGDDFATRQYALAAARCGLTAGEVEALAREWMERRPLPLLAACRYPHLDRLFEGLRRAGKRVAVFSDFPAADKLRALGLAAGTVVCSADPDVRRLKPDPAGLVEETEAFLREAPVFEGMLARGGIRVIKLFLTIGREMQITRLHARWHDPLKRWKLSPIDFEALPRFDDYSRAFDEMLGRTSTETAPWFVVRSNDKLRARLNAIRHVLRAIPYKDKDETAIGQLDDKVVVSVERYLDKGGEPEGP